MSRLLAIGSWLKKVYNDHKSSRVTLIAVLAMALLVLAQLVMSGGYGLRAAWGDSEGTLEFLPASEVTQLE